jgi:signal peptide peptidase SppA
MEITKETIFSSSLRSLFKTLFGTIGIAIAFIPILLTIIILSGSAEKESSIKNTIELLPDANGNKGVLSSLAPVVLKINVNGVIGQKDLTTSVINSQLIESRQTILKNDRVKALFLYINTPGGTVVDSDGIYRLLKEYKEKYNVPIHAYVDGMCASGGMYISSACDYVSASPSSVIGSIGVRLGPLFNFHEGMQKIGISSYTFTAGKDKDMMSPFRPWTEDDKKSYKKILSYLYDRFIQIVTEGHPNINKEELINKHGAQIFDPIEAQKLGFINKAQDNYNNALINLLAAAKIDDKKPYQVIEIKPKHSWIKDALKSGNVLLNGKIKHILQVGQTDLSEEKFNLFFYIYDPKSPFSK